MTDSKILGIVLKTASTVFFLRFFGYLRAGWPMEWWASLLAVKSIRVTATVIFYDVSIDQKSVIQSL